MRHTQSYQMNHEAIKTLCLKFQQFIFLWPLLNNNDGRKPEGAG